MSDRSGPVVDICRIHIPKHTHAPDNYSYVIIYVIESNRKQNTLRIEKMSRFCL